VTKIVNGRNVTEEVITIENRKTITYVFTQTETYTQTISIFTDEIEFLLWCTRDELRKACGVTSATFEATQAVMLVIEELMEAVRTEVFESKKTSWTSAEYTAMYTILGTDYNHKKSGHSNHKDNKEGARVHSRSSGLW
jgi:hypothetical protein